MKSLKFQKTKRVRKRAEYLRLQKKSKRFHTKHLLVCTSRNTENVTPRLGIVATKKIGNAVARNRGKRVVREAFRRNQHLFPNLDIVVILKQGIDIVSQVEIDKELLSILQKRNDNPQNYRS